MDMCKDQQNRYQCRPTGVTITINSYISGQLIDKEASITNLVIIILEGEYIVSIPGIGSCRAGIRKLIFIPANMDWTFEVINPGKTVEILFANLDNFYCLSYFHTLVPLCDTITYKLVTLQSCHALEDYIEYIIKPLHQKGCNVPLDEYEFFVILGVYYPKSLIAKFLYPFLKTLKS